MERQMFDFLEEIAAIASETQSKCKKCGFIRETQGQTETDDAERCPKCGENVWVKTSLLEE